MKVWALYVLLAALGCGGVTERTNDKGADGANGGSSGVVPPSALGEGGAATGMAGSAGESGVPPYGWSCDPRLSEPTGLCRCPNDLCRCDGAFACAPECGDGVTIEQLCISLDDIYLTACRCGEAGGCDVGVLETLTKIEGSSRGRAQRARLGT